MFKLRSKKRDSKKKKPASSESLLSNMAVRIMPVFLALLVLASLLTIFGYSLANLPYFKVKAFEIDGGEGLVSLRQDEFFRAYQGKNIFSVDLKAIADKVHARYADAKDVRVRRILPDKLSIDIYLRRPIALVNDGKYYPVDRDGVILPNANASLWQKLPIITGVNLREVDKVGRRCESQGLNAALVLLKEMHGSRILAEYTVTNIDVSDPKNVSFFLEDGLEVKIGHEDFKERLRTLYETLKNPKLIVSRIKYIDLRFKDIVIGQK